MKARIVAAEDGLPKDSFSVLSCDLDSLSKTAAFADAFLKTGRRLDVLVCNAAVYLPNQQAPTWTADGYEESFGVNHLAHHLLVRKLLPTLARTRGSRCVIVGSITGNSNTVGGGAVLPLADLGGLGGLEAGAKRVAMLGSVKEPFNGAKAYKDAKLANMMTVLEARARVRDWPPGFPGFPRGGLRTRTEPNPTDVPLLPLRETAAPAVQRVDGRDLHVHVPGVHRGDGAVPPEAGLVPLAVPHLHEVRSLSRTQAQSNTHASAARLGLVCAPWY